MTACGPDPDAPKVDGWEVARNTLTQDEACFKKFQPYCIDDVAIVDAVLQKTIDKKHDGVMPDTQKQAEWAAKTSRGSYRTTLQNQHRATLERHIRAYYDNPTLVEVNKDVVTVDLGYLPGPLTERARGDLYLDAAALVENREWKGTEVATKLQALRSQHPQAKEIRLKIRVPETAGSTVAMTYAYHAGHDVLTVEGFASPNKIWYTEKTGGDLSPWVGGEKSLHTHDLKNCTLKSEMMLGEDPNCPL
ncbi:MAG: hypothetical protein HN348_15755 [Proteobacteria bacterium]|nr:hypothetical protein [Pseudomonadota bacterium]